MGVNPVTYWAAETGTRLATPLIVERAMRSFRVSLEFLLLDGAIDEADEVARRTVQLVAELKSVPWADDRTVGHRLKAVRRSAGFSSAAEAVAKFDWKSSIYRQHEAGLRPIPIDRIVVYGKAFGADAMDLVSTSYPSEASVGECPLLCSDDAAAEPWSWLGQPELEGETLLLPLLHLGTDGLLVVVRHRLPVRGFEGIVSPEDRDVYAVQATVRGNFIGSLYLIVRRGGEMEDPAELVVSDGGTISKGASDVGTRVTGDPLLVQGTGMRPLVLGRAIGEVRVRWK